MMPPLPFWLVADAEQPWTGAMPSQVDTGLAQALATAPAMPFPRDVRADLRAESPCLLIFTSGTTGLPKAARYSHMRWMSTGDIMEITLQTTAHDVFYCCLPLYHGAAATSVTSTALKTGAAIVVRRKFSVREFWNDVRKHHVSVFQYIGEICRYLLNQPEVAGERDHGLRCMLGAGLTLDPRWLPGGRKRHLQFAVTGRAGKEEWEGTRRSRSRGVPAATPEGHGGDGISRKRSAS